MPLIQCTTRSQRVSYFYVRIKVEFAEWKNLERQTSASRLHSLQWISAISIIQTRRYMFLTKGRSRRFITSEAGFDHISPRVLPLASLYLNRHVSAFALLGEIGEPLADLAY